MASTPKRPRGRPSLYTPRLAERICERVATTPRGLDPICEAESGFPDRSTVHRWLNAHEEFRDNFSRAKDRQADLLAFQTLEIADTPTLGVEKITRPDGSVETREGDMLGHRRLQVETRLRLAGRLAPKRWGDRQAIEHTGRDGGPIESVATIYELPGNGRDG